MAKWPIAFNDISPGKGNRVRSRRHPFLRDRPKGIWQPDAVGVVPNYPNTQAKFDVKVENSRIAYAARMARGEPQITRRGVPDGWAGRGDELRACRAAAKITAKVLVQKMIDKAIIVADERAEAALAASIEVVIARDEATNLYAHPVKERLTAARLVLDFTKAKPASTQKLEVTKAEDFLAALASDD